MYFIIIRAHSFKQGGSAPPSGEHRSSEKSTGKRPAGRQSEGVYYSEHTIYQLPKVRETRAPYIPHRATVRAVVRAVRAVRAVPPTSPRGKRRGHRA